MTMSIKPANKILLSIIGAAGALSLGAQNVRAQSDWSSGQGGLTCVAGRSGDVATIAGFSCLIANATAVIFVVLGIGGLIMITIGGLRYMLSGGNAQGMEKAKNSIKGVIIGLIVLLSSLLVLTLIKNVTGVDVTKIVFPS